MGKQVVCIDCRRYSHRSCRSACNACKVLFLIPSRSSFQASDFSKAALYLPDKQTPFFGAIGEISAVERNISSLQSGQVRDAVSEVFPQLVHKGRMLSSFLGS